MKPSWQFGFDTNDNDFTSYVLHSYNRELNHQGSRAVCACGLWERVT